MQIFYCDDKILDLEKTENFKHLIKYLEAEAPLSEENFSAQIAYSWYLYCEGDFIDQHVSDEWKFYQNKWIEKIRVAINKYQDYPKISLIAAYSLEISGMDIKDLTDYEETAKKFYELSRKKSEDKNLSKLIDFLSSHRKVHLEENVIKNLFPNDTLVDKYFSEVLLKT